VSFKTSAGAFFEVKEWADQCDWRAAAARVAAAARRIRRRLLARQELLENANSLSNMPLFLRRHPIESLARLALLPRRSANSPRFRWTATALAGTVNKFAKQPAKHSQLSQLF
jgi:hypothetical protein